MKSNCLIFAVKVWLKDPKHTRIHMIWRPLQAWCPHFYWCHKGWYAHFRADDRHLNGFGLLWHTGKISQFPHHKIL